MRSPTLTAVLVLATVLTATAQEGAPETQRFDLSGRGYGDEVLWDFTVSGGRRAGENARIPVPSQWELQGFGSYNYGHDEDKSDERGTYTHRFTLPDQLEARRPATRQELVFEGVMTDAHVTLNDRELGVHRGGFYPFRFDVTGVLRPGENVLVVEVAKVSDDKSVELAERDADYWVFGGIYRPVYLEISPRESITHVAVDARHTGELRAVVELTPLEAPARLRAEVGGTVVDVDVAAGASRAELATRLDGVEPWSAETPRLYDLVVDLERDGEVLHRQRLRIGFRTVEVRPGEGLFVNGRRVLLKGVNRHAFWPDSGRTMNAVLDRRDAELVKAMNMNAVRASHYPPDTAFLDACDEIGLYVLDELAGWHDAYSTKAGTPLVRAMVRRDVNHPSVILWDNGNEGGWNDKLDAVFAEHDPQGRLVLHPDDPDSAGFDSEHYPTWEELRDRLHPERLPFWRSWWYDDQLLVMPTEFLHGLYDGGSGAGLEDYWRLIRKSPRGAGGFLWAFSDESVVRADRDGALDGVALDSDGNHAPDGILGPRRELSANFDAVREVFSPVQVLDGFPLGDGFDGTFRVENRFHRTNMSQVTFDWAFVRLPPPWTEEDGLAVLAEGSVPGPPAEPGKVGRLSLGPLYGDAVRLTARDPQGRELRTWVLPRRERRAMSYRWLEDDWQTAAGVESVDDLQARVWKSLLKPRLVPDGPLDVRYAEAPSGWIRVLLRYRAVPGARQYSGVVFPLPLDDVVSVEWLGRGPGRVWKNRRHGTVGLWRKENRAAPPGAAHEPLTRGFYGDVYWMRVTTGVGSLVVVVEGEVDVGLVPPAFPDDAKDARAAVPEVEGLGVFHGIPAIGTKFHPASELGPQSLRHDADDFYTVTLWLLFER